MTSWRRVLRRAVDASARAVTRSRSGAPPATRTPRSNRSDAPPMVPPRADGRYPGDFQGRVEVGYAPSDDGRPDPGEVVWAWVPYEEDHAQGKDRPVLLVGRDGPWLLGLPLTSKDHDRDQAEEAEAGRYWVDVGSGGWDRRGRASEVRVDRVVRIDPAVIRREGSVLERGRFDAVIAGMHRHRG